MTTVSIAEVALQPNGSLSIRPALHEKESMEFIWRAANGVRWDAASRSLVHVSDSAPDPLAWFSRILFASEGEYGYALAVTPHTRWIGVPRDAQAAMERFARQSAQQC